MILSRFANDITASVPGKHKQNAQSKSETKCVGNVSFIDKQKANKRKKVESFNSSAGESSSWELYVQDFVIQDCLPHSCMLNNKVRKIEGTFSNMK